MQLQVFGDVTIVVLPARVDTINAQEVETQFDELLAGGARKLVADFAGTEYISSAGLRVFLATLKLLQKNDGRIVLCALPPFIAEVFEISGFSGLFEIVATSDEALAALA
jgi:stage II sporulation protein AA (anti-sigma F factor antagonist)